MICANICANIKFIAPIWYWLYAHINWIDSFHLSILLSLFTLKIFNSYTSFISNICLKWFKLHLFLANAPQWYCQHDVGDNVEMRSLSWANLEMLMTKSTCNRLNNDLCHQQCCPRLQQQIYFQHLSPISF